MRFYPVKTPKIFKFIFKKWIWSFNPSEKTVYLTFDDGPIPEITPWVLGQLNEYNAKATFFCIGDNIQKHQNVFNQILKEKHRVENHTFNHLNGWKTNTDFYIKNTLLAENHLPKKTQKLFRPPFGKITNKQSKQLRKLGYKIIMWDVLSGDFDKNITPETCTKNVMKNVKNGSIVVFHDSKKAYPRLKVVLPKTLDFLSKQGYVFKTIP